MDVAVGRRTGVTSVVRDPRAIEWRELVPLWLAAGLWGLLAGSALLVGAAIGYFARVPTRLIAAIMAFGSGVLISALSFDLMDEAYKRGGFDSKSCMAACSSSSVISPA